MQAQKKKKKSNSVKIYILTAMCATILTLKPDQKACPHIYDTMVSMQIKLPLKYTV